VVSVEVKAVADQSYVDFGRTHVLRVVAESLDAGAKKNKVPKSFGELFTR
jgi:hypothetical protein